MGRSRRATAAAVAGALALAGGIAGGIAGCSTAVSGTSADRHAGHHAASSSPPGGPDPSSIGQPVAGLVPAQIERVYNVGPLRRQGIDGAHQTIVVVDSFGSPTIARDLAAFDTAFGLRAPASLRVIQPAGPGAALPADQRPHRLGIGDHAGRGVGARDGPGRQHRAGRDADGRERGPDRLPADRHGREVRAEPPSGPGDQPELRRDRGDVQLPGPAEGPARRLPAGRPGPGHGAGGQRRQRGLGRDLQHEEPV